MKNLHKSIFGLVLTIAVFSQSYGQEIDQERMERDLKIAENILGTLSGGDRNLFSYSRDVESNYIPDYGVIFNLPQYAMLYKTSGSRGVEVVAPSVGSTYSYAISESVASDENDAKKDTKTEAKDMMAEIEKQLKEQMTLFLVDYADLIGQLKASDHIMVNIKSRKNQVWISGEDLRARSGMGMTAEILKSDLIAYKQGKSTREETTGKIKFTSKDDSRVERDLELFSSIFSRLYEPDLSSTYYASSRNINYERLENLGVIFNMRVYSSTEDKNLYTIRTTGESGLTQEERNEKVNAMYPEFEKSMRENILDYGRTIRSLKASEMLILKVKLTECKGCEMPETIELSVKAKTLKDYDSGIIKREDALKSISLKKTDR